MKRLIRSAAVATLFTVSAVFAQTGTPVKIGAMIPATGPLSGPAAAAKAGIELAMEEVGYRAGGRPIEVIFDDYQFKADIAVTSARKLVERENVDVLIGPDGTHACLAIRGYMAEKGIPWIVTQCTGKDLSPPAKAAPNLFRASFQYNQHHPIMAKYVLEKLKYKRIVAVGLDYAAGHEETQAFVEAFVAGGGQVETIYMPIGSIDPSPYVARIVPSKFDAVFVNLWGIDAARFIKAAAEYGLTKRLPFFANGTAVEDADTLPAAGDAAVGILNYRTYSAAYDTPMNKAFVARVEKKTGQLPNQYLYSAYAAAKSALYALNATGGKTDKAALVAALRKVSFDAPGGRFRFDANQQAVKTLFIRRAAKKNGRFENELVDVIPDISPPK